ncbi:Mut7-C RNAse domain-containing protein [Nitrospinota bacterium]
MKVLIRVYEELNNYLPPDRRKVAFSATFDPETSMKEIVDTLGIPLSEVDLILANGDSVDLSHRPRDGNRISLYPVFESIDVSPLVKVRARPLRRIRFVLDVHLGRLATYLRMLGFDTLYRNDYEDEELVRLSVDEGRVLLTQDRGLLRRKEVVRGCLVREPNPRRQLENILARFDLHESIDPFGRCLRCNTLLKPAAKEEVRDHLPPETQKQYDEFWVCSGCGRIYWKGKHYEHMQRFIEEVSRR